MQFSSLRKDQLLALCGEQERRLDLLHKRARGEPGSIQLQEAYAQGKMLESTGWRDVLPRKCYPSDCDLWFADGQRFLLCEFAKRARSWLEVPNAQRRCYEDALRAMSNGSCAVLCCHSVPSDRQVNTMVDLDHFQVMRLGSGGIRYDDCQPGEDWPGFVLAFYGRN